MKILQYATDKSGVTLIELMIVMVLSLMLTGAAYLSFQVLHKTNIVHEQTTYVQQDLRAAMDIISRDILNAGSAGSGIVVTASTTGLNRIGMRCPSWVGYSLNGTDLIRDDGTSNILISNVTSFGLSYFDGNTAAIALPLDSTTVSTLRYLGVYLCAQSNGVDPDTGNPVERYLNRNVGLRNLQ